MHTQTPPQLCDWLKFLFPMRRSNSVTTCWGVGAVGIDPWGDTLWDGAEMFHVNACVWVEAQPLDPASDGGTNSTPTWLKSKGAHVQVRGCYHWTLHTSVLSHQAISPSLNLCFCALRLWDAVGADTTSLPVCPRHADRVSPFLPFAPKGLQP